MKISEHKIEEVREAADIVDVISGYIHLKRRGRNFIGLCPFHHEKTPSFTVSEEKQIFHCFGCHAGGNVFKFLMEFKSISFVEAVKEIAGSLGINVEEEEGYYNAENDNEVFYEINVSAAKYFSDNLLKNKEGETAREYFKKRNIKLQIQKNFGLGYALPGWDNLLKFLQKEKIDLEKARILGLIDSKDSGGFYDKYRGRVIYPIFSTNGRVIAFGGRVLENNENVAKYLNSPESLIYSKRKTLYGLYHSKEEIRKLDKAILVEGYMDVIALYQAGVKNIVASSGTVLTEEQVQLLSRFTRNVVVNFDADEAGQKASMRSIEILLKYDFDVRILDLPDGEDPDSYVNKFGKKEFEELVNRSGNFLEYQVSRYEKTGKLSDPAGQAEAIRELVKNAALVSDELKRSLLLKSIAKKFNLREKLLETEMDKFIKENNKSSSGGKKQIPIAKNPVQEKQTPAEQIANPVEKDLVKLLFESDAEVTGWVFDTIIPEEFVSPVYRRIAEIVFDCYKQNIISAPDLIEKFDDDELKTFILKMTIDTNSISRKWDESEDSNTKKIQSKQKALDLLKRYKSKQILQQLKELNTSIERLENENRNEELKELLLFKNELKIEEVRLKNIKSFDEI